MLSVSDLIKVNMPSYLKHTADGQNLKDELGNIGEVFIK